MTVRVYGSRDNAPAMVEQFNSGRKKGCIVRWDYQIVKTIKEAEDKRANFRKRKALSRAANGDKEALAKVQEQEAAAAMPQGEEVDSGLVSFSEMRYPSVPEWERVEADITNDLNLRYGAEGERPEIDLDAYRTAIAAISHP